MDSAKVKDEGIESLLSIPQVWNIIPKREIKEEVNPYDDGFIKIENLGLDGLYNIHTTVQSSEVTLIQKKDPLFCDDSDLLQKPNSLGDKCELDRKALFQRLKSSKYPKVKLQRLDKIKLENGGLFQKRQIMARGLSQNLSLDELLSSGDEEQDVDAVIRENTYDSDAGEEYVPSLEEEEDMASDDNPYAFCSTSASLRKRTLFLHRAPSTTVVTTKASAFPPTTTTTAASTTTTAIDVEDLHHTLPRVSLHGRNGHRWSTKPFSKTSSRTPQRNIVTSQRPGPAPHAANAETPDECFQLLFSPDMLQEIVTHTNNRIATLGQKYKRQYAFTGTTCSEEIAALIGLLIYSGGRRDNHLTTEEMWTSGACIPLYRAAMSERRFCYLLRCLRFDDSRTRHQRLKNDILAPIRNLWDLFVNNCKSSYIPGANLTVDEQLLAFRGRCSFRMYIPNKPAKYGMKIVMMCDVESKYMVNAIPYLGKQTSNAAPHGMQLGHYLTKELSKPYQNSGRNVTTDNWFTSVQLAMDLLDSGLTTVGTLRTNKAHIPPEMVTPTGRKKGTSAFCFDKDLTMVSFYPRTKKKNVLLLSSMHNTPAIDDVKKKPEVITYYNATKGAVNAFDQMISMYSCRRKTRRWPMCLFYGIINAATLNAWVIYRGNCATKHQPRMNRRKFMTDLGLKLVRPWAEKRLHREGMENSVKVAIREIFDINPQFVPIPTAGFLQTQKRCVKCSRKEDRKTKTVCSMCNNPVCSYHSLVMCLDCK